MDEVTTIEEITNTITEYREQNVLDRYDTIFELIKAINVEAGELLEIITFPLEAEEMENKRKTKQELADVLIYSFALADYLGFDVDDIIREKIEYNKKRGRKYD